jgi:Fic family protein
MISTELLLAGSPYLVDSDDASLSRIERARERSVDTRTRGTSTNVRIRLEAQDILGPYLNATRMDLVAESNLIEGMIWEQGQVREVISTHRSLLNGPVHSLTETVRADPKLYEVLGLYRAHEIADIWLEEDHVPRAADIRALHNLILGDIRGSGSYKQFDNQIAGRPDHKTTSPNEVSRVMLEMTDWWASSSGDPLLTATAIHAWLAHVHPFEDGNGRIARILANVELARHNYPPLIVRATDDRGQYYAALQASDEGDILPLYELFERVIRRQSKFMARASYVQDIINDRLLASEMQRYQLWRSTLDRLTEDLTQSLRRKGLDFALQGTLSAGAFALLSDRDVDGNGWYGKVSRNGQTEWLLWFGYRSELWCELSEPTDIYPSIFISRRDRRPDAAHPYTREYSMKGFAWPLPEEVHLMPAQRNTVHVRRAYEIVEMRSEDFADNIADAFASAPLRD